MQLGRSCASHLVTILTIRFCALYLVHLPCLSLLGVQVCSSRFTFRTPCEHRINTEGWEVEILPLRAL